MEDTYEPAQTINGKPSYEAELLWQTFQFCKHKLANADLDKNERKALNFYVEQLHKIIPCPDEDRFKKPGKGIGGYGDSEIIMPYVVRDHQTHKPLLKSDGSLLTIQCRFHDVSRYLFSIKTQRAESLNIIDGVHALSAADQRLYQKPDPYSLSLRSNASKSALTK